jgi:molecular chaperone DnaK (HSP70)
VMVAYNKEKNQFKYFNFDQDDEPIPTSSTVWYHDNLVEVGQHARDNINKYGDVEGHHFERSIKLKLGSGQRLNIFGLSVEPYVVAGTILNELKKTAINDWHADKTGVDLSRAVFTVPINFDGKARRDLRKSANEAGIDVTTFIHEPFAAIVGYFFTKYEADKSEDIIRKMKNLDGKYLLTFDWGGGTLDITVVQVSGQKMLELGTAELTDVAGDKFDEEIAKYAWNKVLDKYGSKYSEEYLETVRKNKWDKLLAIAEKCKLQLSSRESSLFFLERVTSNNEDIDFTLTRADFEGLIANALDAASNKIDEAIRQAGIQDIDLSHVLLTGGSCYIPAVRDRMIEKFGQRVENAKNADLVIAQGAAVIAEMGWLPFLSKDTQIELSDGSFWPIFEHGMPVASQKPAQNSEVFSCIDQRQKRAKIIVCEGLGQRKDKNLAVFNVPLLGDARFGDDVVIEAILDKDIVLTVKGHSKMVMGYGRDENKSIRKSAEIYQLCFGLDFEEA